MKIKLSCRESARLLLEGEERELSGGERLSLQMHLAICHACRRFVGQLDFMRRATRAWRNDADDAHDAEGPHRD